MICRKSTQSTSRLAEAPSRNPRVAFGFRVPDFFRVSAFGVRVFLALGLVPALRTGAAELAPSLATLNALPLFFEPMDQPDGAPPSFLARGQNYQFLVTPSGVQFALRKPGVFQPPQRRSPMLTPPGVQARVGRMDFLGAAPHARLSGGEQLPGRINYLLGNDSAKWRQNVATFGQVRVTELYAGIDLLYYGNQSQLEYDFQVAPGIDPSVITFRFEGVDQVAIGPQGELVLSLGDGQVRQQPPALYQLDHGVRREVRGGYHLKDSRTVGFEIGAYDRELPLVIDPIFSYSTYFGGNGGEAALAIKVDTNACVYIAGETLSTQFPFSIPTNAFQRQFKGGSVNGDAFVAKLDNTGSRLVYFTYLGGSSDDGALDLALDSLGNAYVAGFTTSSNFPTHNALYGQINGTPDSMFHAYPADAFVAELNTNGSALVYSTYLGGSGGDVASAIAVDRVGNAYVTGYTFSTNFPRVNAIQSALAGVDDVFVTKIAAGGVALVYSTYLGGTGTDEGQGIAVDAGQYAYVTGYTSSTNLPVSAGAWQKTLNGPSGTALGFDAFAAKFYPAGTLVYSTFLGGLFNDYGYRIAADTQGNAYITGATQSPDFPNTATNVPGLYAGNTTTNAGIYYDAFLTKLGSFGSNLVYSAMFGGTNSDSGFDVAVDSVGRAFVIGTTASPDFPVISPVGLFTNNHAAFTNVFVIAFSSNATSAYYSGVLGGTNIDYGYGIAVDSESSAYITGLTFSTNFPITSAPFQRSLSGPSGAFLAKIRLLDPTLTAALASPNLRLRWPASAADFGLQSALSLTHPVLWAPVSQTPLLVNGFYTVTLGLTNDASFFRLYHH